MAKTPVAVQEDFKAVASEIDVEHKTVKFKDEAGTEYLFVAQSWFPCGFCNGQLVAGLIDGENETLLHVDPLCETFKTTELAEFLEMNRRKLGLPEPEVEIEPPAITDEEPN